MLLIISSQENAREIETERNGVKDTIKAVDLVLTDGLNMYLVTAFEKEAQRLLEHPAPKGGWIRVDLSFVVRTSKTERGERAFQSIRLNKFVFI